MSKLHTRTNVVNSLLWKLLERAGSQGVQFVVQIILARLLSPKEFGTIAILLVFTNIATVFIQGGFNAALIQKKDPDELDYSSVFYFSLLASLVLYGIIAYFSPAIGLYYQDDNLAKMLRVISLILFPGALNSVQNAYIMKNMQFRKLFLSTLSATVLSGVIGIATAYLGYGIWALIIQQIIYAFSNAILLHYTTDWHPKLMFSFRRIKSLFSYGIKVLSSSIIYTLYLDGRTLLIGKIYQPFDLAYYQRGEQMPRIIVSNIDASIQGVMLPTLAAYQEDPRRMKSILRRSIKVSAYIIFPAMVGMATTAETLVKVLLTDKWLPSVPFLQIFCITYALWPILTLNLQPMRAMGEGGLLLKTEIIKRSIGLGIILATLKYGIIAIALGAFVERVIEVIINAIPNRQLVNYTLYEQFKDVLPSIIHSVLMGVTVYLVGFMDVNIYLLLFLQVSAGMLTYLLLSIIFKHEIYQYILGLIKERLPSRSDTMKRR